MSGSFAAPAAKSARSHAERRHFHGRHPNAGGAPPAPSPGDEAEPVRPSVLIAEDHEDSLDALRTLLEAFGFRVYGARNGQEAVEQALAHAPDLVLMDMMMPQMDGLQATRLLRASPGFRQVPIIAVTALEGSREQVLAAGCDDMVLKPIDVRGFVDRVRAWMGAGRAVAS
jgi:CheY-like chemotaxis protein